MSEDFISGLHDDLVEAMDRYERRSPRGRLAAGRFPRLLRPAALARVAAGAALIVALVGVVLTVGRESDVERPVAPPGKKLVATDVEAGVRFSLDGRVLTVQLLEPVRNQTFETVSGAEISATCGTNVAAPPGDPRSETTVFRIWPAGETSLSFRFPRDVSSWCRLDRQSVGIVAGVSFPGARSGAKGPIARQPTRGRGTSPPALRPAPTTCAAQHATSGRPTASTRRSANRGYRFRPAGERRGSGQRRFSARRPRESPEGATERPQRSPTTSSSSCDVPRRASGRSPEWARSGP